MNISRDNLYRFPWSKKDNPGGWVEVTDQCDLHCPGCYRHSLEGHRPLDEVKQDILLCQRLTNCDRLAIAGGEPLLYPDIFEVVDFISHRRMKPVILTNGRRLTWEAAVELKKAGLAKFHFHVDSGQKRPGWVGKSEAEMNTLRQHFADLVWQLGGVQCGYNVTVFRSTLKELPDILDWAKQNIHKVQHISLVAYRGIPVVAGIRFQVNGKIVDAHAFQHSASNLEDISLSSEEMFAVLKKHSSDYKPCAFLNGTHAPETYKFLITVHVGGKDNLFGYMGKKSVEMTQSTYHFINGRYFLFLNNPGVGKKLFLLSLVDREMRKTLRRYLKVLVRNPQKIFEKVNIQSISLQQPNEFLKDEANLCDGCMNMMVYRGELIPSCRLDEYRIFGGPLKPVISKRNWGSSWAGEKRQGESRDGANRRRG